MFTVLLSDRALKDFSDSPKQASECLKSLTQSISTLGTYCISQHAQITKLKYFKPNAWRYRHFCNSVWYRIVFTIAHDESLIIHRILQRSEIDYRRDLPEYLYKDCRGDEAVFVDLDDEQHLDPSSTPDIEFDQVYRDYSRHYRLPQSLIAQATSPELLSEYILSGSYLHRPRLTNEQEDLSLNLMKQSSHIIQIQGAAGTGKTTLAFHLADIAIALGFHPLVVVPNTDLQQFGRSLIDGLDKHYQVSLNLEVQDNSALRIITAESLFQKLSDDAETTLSTVEANRRICQAFQDHNLCLPKRLEKVNLYAVQQAVIESDNQYALSSGDSLMAGQEQAVEWLRRLKEQFKYKKRYREFSDLYEHRDLASQAKRALKKIESCHSNLNSLSDSNKPIALIIDEVQDYYWLQLKVVYALLKRYDVSGLLMLLGDENQRVTISGFTWTALANSFKQTYNVRLPGTLQLTRNFRNTKAIARVAGFFLEKAFPIGQVVAGGKHPQKLPDPETCFEEGLPPRIIEFDTNWLSEFICCLKSTRTSGTSSRFVLIVHEASEHYSRFKQEFSPDSEQVVVLNVQQAKGQEFDAVILVSPFLLKKEHLSLDDLFEWYTSITRARRYEAILVSPEEMQWLRANVNQPEQLETLFAICSNLKLEGLTKEVLLEGRSFLTTQQLQKLFISQAAASIADWVIADQPLPEVTIGCQRYNLNWWNICEEIETEVWELLSHQKLAPGRLQAVLDALRAERLLQDLPVLYFGTKRLLAQAQVNLKPIAAQVVQRLEQWFRVSPQDVIPALSQVKNLELRVMLLRVVGHSWQAADLLRLHSAEDWIEEVALDLERRELPYEAARLRVQYLGQQYPSDYPLVEVLSQTEPLSVALCSYFTKIMETLA